MKASEIRERVTKFRETIKLFIEHLCGEGVTATREDITLRVLTEQTVYLGEVAAQLAELNENLRDIHPELHLPEECRKHQCDYHLHYLRYGGPDMSHEAYHAASKQAEEHAKTCNRCNHGTEACPSAARYERELRA